MTLEELKNSMPNCVRCGRHCPIDELNCERGQEMVNKILAGEITAEECLKKAEERKKAHEGRGCCRRDQAEGRGPHGPGFCSEGHGPGFRGPGFGGPGFGSHHHGPGFGPEGHGPGFGPEGHGPAFGGPGFGPRHHRPMMPQDDSLGSLLFFAVHAVMPRPRKVGPGMAGIAQHRVLKLLSETSEISQQSLMEILAIRPGSLSELLKKLEDKGYIVRTPDETDKRKNTLSLTDAGKEALAAAEDRKDPFAVLSEEEQEQLKALLKKIIEANRG